MYQSEYQGVLFIEGTPDEFEALGPVQVSIDGFGLTQAQLMTLDDVKDLMLSKVRELGGNAVVDFKYGQKSVGFWKSLMSLDDVAWYGTGTIAKIPEESP